MRRYSIGLSTVTLAVALAAAGVPAAAEASPASDWHSASEPRGVLVRFEPSSSANTRRHARSAGDVTLDRRFPLVHGLQLVRVSKGEDPADVARTLEAQAGVRYAEPDLVRRASTLPNDPLFGGQWALQNTGQASGGLPGKVDFDLDAVDAWSIVSGGPVRVAVIDSGIAYDHPDLAPNVFANPGESGGGRETNGIDDDANGFVDDFRGWDFVNGDNDPYDDEGHGTHVSGTIAARGNNGIGTTGVAWQASLIPVKAGAADGSFLLSDILAAYSYAWSMGARVVNASFGGFGASVAEQNVLAAARDVLFVAAAGNEANNNDGADRAYPCSYALENVICVAAADRWGSLADFSNYGKTNVDLAAPGVGILSQGLSGETILSETFDTGAATRWVPGGVLGTSDWATSTALFSSPLKSLTDSPAGDYAPDEDTHTALAAPFSLTGKSDCWVDYKLNAETETDYDVFSLEADSGSGWVVIDGGSGSTDGEFIDLQAPLDEFDNQPSVRLRFRLVTDSVGEYDGVYVDDLAVRCPGAFTGSETAWMDGTSMAAPHVTGTAALVLAQWPGAPVSYVRRALLGSVTPDAQLSPFVATGGMVNARAAIDDAGPTPFSLVGPANGAAVASGLQTLTWGATSDAKTGVQKLQLIVDGKVAADNLPPTATQLEYHFAEGLHGWTIRAIDNVGRSTYAPPASIRVDSVPPSVSFSASPRKLRRLVRRGRARLRVKVNEAARVSGVVRMTIPRTEAGRRHRITLRRTAAVSQADAPALGFKLSRRQRGWLAEALPHLRRLRVRVVVAATDSLENRRAETKRVKIKLG